MKGLIEVLDLEAENEKLKQENKFLRYENKKLENELKFARDKVIEKHKEIKLLRNENNKMEKVLCSETCKDCKVKAAILQDIEKGNFE